MMKRADMGDYPVAALLLLGRRGLGHWCRSLKIFELYLDMQIISCIIVDGLALLNFLFNYLHYVLGGTGSADRK